MAEQVQQFQVQGGFGLYWFGIVFFIVVMYFFRNYVRSVLLPNQDGNKANKETD